MMCFSQARPPKLGMVLGILRNTMRCVHVIECVSVYRLENVRRRTFSLKDIIGAFILLWWIMKAP